MPVKKLLEAVIFGFGATAGKRAFEELEESIEKEPETKPEPKPMTPAERAKSDKAAKKAKAREERAIDDELAALKKRLKK